ncbi:polymerase [Xinjiang tick rhabdovirus]|uniref:Replicase n=1 Tax=Xinjiang tick rhabdovirus TaxID=2560016 RepID=A0A482LV38_9RHAB|nr:polymerase [Xinjiang tick rhabdovirus]QBQ65046.1 polymerase [Xinjiang tick rhabdovirus]
MDNFEFLETEDFDYYDNLELDTFEDFEISQDAPTGTGFISQDYNLNSPLIVDAMVNGFKYLTGNEIEPRYKHLTPELDDLIKITDKLNYNRDNLCNPIHNHRRMEYLFNLKADKLLKIDPVDRWEEIHEMTEEIPTITIRKILNIKREHDKNWIHRLKLLPRDETSNVIFHNEWNLFLETHFIIHFLNSGMSHQSTGWISQIFHVKRIKKPPLDEYTLLGKSKSDIHWIIGKSFVINLKSHQLFDKNFLLMLKDICLARVMSLLSITYRYDQPDLDLALKLRSFYDKGDKLLSRYGDEGYDIIKLVEAEAVSRWNEIGQIMRPKIPLANDLFNHLETYYTTTKAHLDINLIYDFVEIIRLEDDPWMIGQYYGAFRHWGHPYINYLEGLRDLERRVNEDIDVDEEYAEALASDLAYLILRGQFQGRKKWFARSTGLPKNSPLKECIDTGVWPTAKVIEDFGPNWHKLDLIPCFEVPDSIDITDLFNDKAHSLNRNEVIEHIQSNNNRPIPARRVMETLLTEETVDIPKFLRNIDENGLEWDDLVIGLKAKERELKRKGRFFSLMSWNLRLYFVITEYLIKKHYVPLFSGLTMADDLTTVTKKLLAATSGQGSDNYNRIFISNSLDYDKWNNRQRMTSNRHVFQVMGQFLGYPNLFLRTHEFFENSLIYYNERPDLMSVQNRRVVNVNINSPVVWEGQLGGFEGLRQKGWSVLNYLVLRREALTRNTQTKFLAQGDNQIVITQYTPMSSKNDECLDREIQNIWDNNKEIMTRIRIATGKLGLIINEDEVITSAELLIYGKTPVFRGKVIPLETKRWSRISTVNNDQLPSFSNSLASVTTNALSVNQFSESTDEVILNHHFFGGFTISLISYYNAIVGIDPFDWETLSVSQKQKFCLRLLYKDPSVGGACGTNYLRFIISRFPDPLCESLTWWKILSEQSASPIVKALSEECGNPKIGEINILTQTMLLEDPTSLNIPGGLSSDTMIKNKIFEGLTSKIQEGKITNQMIKESVMFSANFKGPFINWLFKITPVFPRFLSEFYTGTYFRITEGLVSIFQNSRTIRKTFSKNFNKELYQVIVKSEQMSIKSVTKPRTGYLEGITWSCSASHCDKLRKISWGPKLVGVTVPHPAEFLIEKTCTHGCEGAHIVAKKVKLSERRPWSRGPLNPYLGSKTKESTSILQPWEKHIEVPLIKRASDLRKAINWFILPGSKLAESIYSNLNSLTGLDLREEIHDYQRTGSSQHRLRCARVSSEGNPAIGFNNLMYVTVTTDSLGELNEHNHDFMYQSVICWAGIVSTLPGNRYGETDVTHFHIADPKCIRQIEEHVLESPSIFPFPDKSKQIKKMITKEMEIKLSPRFTEHRIVDWTNLSPEEKSWEVGRAQGFLWGLAVYNNTTETEKDILFPTTVSKKVHPIPYMFGIHRGFSLGASLTPSYTRYGSLSEKARLKFEGSYWNIVDKAVNESNLPNIINQKSFQPILRRMGNDVIKSYPAAQCELVEVIRRWFLRRLISDRLDKSVWTTYDIIAFAEMNDEYTLGMFRLAESILPVFQYSKLSTTSLHILKNAMKTMRNLNDYKEQQLPRDKITRLQTVFRSPKFPKYAIVPSEIRHAVSDIPPMSKAIDSHYDQVEYNEFDGLGGSIVKCDFQPAGLTKFDAHTIEKYQLLQIRCTLFSSVRLIQWSTGAHYKYKDLTLMYEIKGDGIFCGDGSGGIGANHLRKNLYARVIFNSKLDLGGESWKGLAPAGPGAYTVSGPDVIERCVNYSTCWEEPSDLSLEETWINFLSLIKVHHLDIEVICCDAEIFDFEVTNKVEDMILKYVPLIFKRFTGMLIYKTYWSRLLDNTTICHKLSQYFLEVDVTMPRCQGSFTSEVYIVAQRLRIPEVPLQTELTLATIDMIYQSLKVYSTYESEFNRAKELSYYLAIKGMELKVPFTKLEDIAIYLTTVGVETGLALTMSELLCAEIGKGLHPYGFLVFVGFMISRSLLPITFWYKKHRKMPSSNRLQKMIAALFGLWFGVIYLTDDVTSFSTLTNVYQGDIPLQVYRSHTIFKKKKTKAGKILTTDKALGRIMSWKICNGPAAKVIDPGPRAGITQQMTRMMIILYQGKNTLRPFEKEDVLQCNEMLQTFDKIATVRKILTRTGIDFSKILEYPVDVVPINPPPEAEDELPYNDVYTELE